MPLAYFPVPELLTPQLARIALMVDKEFILANHPNVELNLSRAMNFLAKYDDPHAPDASFTHMVDIMDYESLTIEVYIRLAGVYKQFRDEIARLTTAYENHEICLSDLENDSDDAAVIRDYWIKKTLDAYKEGLKIASHQGYPILGIVIR